MINIEEQRPLIETPKNVRLHIKVTASSIDFDKRFMTIICSNLPFLAAHQSDNLVVEIGLLKANSMYKLRCSVSNFNLNAPFLFTHATEQRHQLILWLIQVPAIGEAL